MKKIVFIIAIFIFSTYVFCDLKAQKRIGVVFNIEDSLITHTNLGFSALSNFDEEYILPFDLQDYSKSVFLNIFSLSHDWYQLIEVNKEILDEFLLKKESLKRKEFKVYSKSWYEKLKKDKGLDAIILVENVNPDLVYGMSSRRLETGKVALRTGQEMGKNQTGVFIRMQVSLIYSYYPKKLEATDFESLSDKMPKVEKGERFTVLQLMEFESPLKTSIRKQFLEIRNNPRFTETMKLELDQREEL